MWNWRPCSQCTHILTLTPVLVCRSWDKCWNAVGGGSFQQRQRRYLKRKLKVTEIPRWLFMESSWKQSQYELGCWAIVLTICLRPWVPECEEREQFYCRQVRNIRACKINSIAHGVSASRHSWQIRGFGICLWNPFLVIILLFNTETSRLFILCAANWDIWIIATFPSAVECT